MRASRSIVPPQLELQGGVGEGRDGQQPLHQGRDGGDQAGLWCGSDVMQGIHPARDQTDMGRAALVWQGFPSREQGEGGRRKADEIMEKVQVIKEAFSRLVRPGNDQPRSIPQFAQLRMQERGKGKPGGGAVQAGDRRTACSAS